MGDNVIPFRPRRQQPTEGWIETYRRFWGESLDRLTAYLSTIRHGETNMDNLKINAPAGEPVCTITRTLDAPRALVWKAISQPERLIQWWGPHGHVNKVTRFDFSVPGKWRIESRNQAGELFVFIGEYREITPIERVVQTFGMENMWQGQYSVETLTLTEMNGRTEYKVVAVFNSLTERDGMIASGMERGVRQGFERLDALLEDWAALA
jgi:uncharacterized protein YndB with AHSA1/START domain